LQVVKARLGIVDIATVAEGVILTQGGSKAAGSADRITPGVVGVADDGRAGAVQNSYYITLQVRCVVVGGAIVGDGQGRTGGVVVKVQGVATHGYAEQRTAGVDIAVGGAAIRPLGPEAVGVIGVCPGGGAVGHGCQFSAMLPGKGPAVQGVGVADAIVGNGRTVVGGKQIAPGFVGVGVLDGIRRRAQSAGGGTDESVPYGGTDRPGGRSLQFGGPSGRPVPTRQSPGGIKDFAIHPLHKGGFAAAPRPTDFKQMDYEYLGCAFLLPVFVKVHANRPLVPGRWGCQCRRR